MKCTIVLFADTFFSLVFVIGCAEEERIKRVDLVGNKKR